MKLNLAEIDNTINPGGSFAILSEISFKSDPKSPFATSPLLTGRLSSIPAVGRQHAGVAEHDPYEIISFCIQPDESLDEVSRSANQLDWYNQKMLAALARAVDVRSPWTANHSKRVADLAVQIGSVVGLTSKDLDDLRYAALLHDIGKLGISTSILEKPGKLNKNERRCVGQHPQIGARILAPITTYSDIVPIVLQHHELFNGKGYPYGLAGDAICLGARILAVSDVYDALASERPYSAGRRQKGAVEFIKRESGRKFDPKIVKVFLDVMIKEEKAGCCEKSERILDIALPRNTSAPSLIPVDFFQGRFS